LGEVIQGVGLPRQNAKATELTLHTQPPQRVKFDKEATSDGNGTLAVDQPIRIPGAMGRDMDELTFTLYKEEGQEWNLPGSVKLIKPQGWSVISDIDDTIRQTGILDYAHTFRTTFIDPFRVVPGMTDFYHTLSLQLSSDLSNVNASTSPLVSDVAFHYLSASPVALLYPLQDFFRAENFPSGPIHLSEITTMSMNSIRTLLDVSTYKLHVLRRIVEDFPQRNFIFIGDSGQTDPMVYGTIYREMMHANPQRIPPCIYIRLVGGVNPVKEAILNMPERFRYDFRDIRSDRWMLFTNAEELYQVRPGKGGCYPPGKQNTWVEENMEVTQPVTRSDGFVMTAGQTPTEIAREEVGLLKTLSSMFEFGKH